ncbi:MAG: hypothetical protein ABIT16_13785 [Croceibacterium sp.]
MTDKPQDNDPAERAPEAHNSEQDDEQSQAQEVADEARSRGAEGSPLDSTKAKGGDDGDSTQDLIDHMRDMEQSGRIDMGAYRGEPNLDDDDDKYGEGHAEDD